MADRVSFLVLKFWESFLRMQLKGEKIHENSSRKESILSWEKQGNFVCFLRNAREIYSLKLYLNIDRRIGFLLHPRFHRIMFNSETNRERVMLSVRLRRKDNRLVNTCRIIVHKSSSVKRASMREIRLLGSKDVSTRRTITVIFHEPSTNFIESLRFNRFPTISFTLYSYFHNFRIVDLVLFIFVILLLSCHFTRITFCLNSFQSFEKRNERVMYWPIDFSFSFR